MTSRARERELAQPVTARVARVDVVRRVLVQPVVAQERRSEDDANFLVDFIMDKLKYSKLAHYANKIAVDHGPGLTTTQLMVRTPLRSMRSRHELTAPVDQRRSEAC